MISNYFRQTECFLDGDDKQLLIQIYLKWWYFGDKSNLPASYSVFNNKTNSVCFNKNKLMFNNNFASIKNTSKNFFKFCFHIKVLGYHISVTFSSLKAFYAWVCMHLLDLFWTGNLYVIIEK